MKIAVISSEATETPPQGWGGIERSAYAFALAACELGHEVHLYTRKPWPLHMASVRFRHCPEAYSECRPADYGAVWVFNIEAKAWMEQMAAAYPRVPFAFEQNFPSLPTTATHHQNIVHFAACRAVVSHLAARNCRVCFGDPILWKAELGFSKTSDDYILWMGRISSDKNPEALPVFAEAARCRLIVAGPIEDRPLPKSPNIDYVGVIYGEAKRRWLMQAAALLYTVNPCWLEAGAITVAEALACGVPVLAQIGREGDPIDTRLTDGADGFSRTHSAELAGCVPLLSQVSRSDLYAKWSVRLDPNSVVAKRLEDIFSSSE